MHHRSVNVFQPNRRIISLLRLPFWDQPPRDPPDFFPLINLAREKFELVLAQFLRYFHQQSQRNARLGGEGHLGEPGAAGMVDGHGNDVGIRQRF